MPKHKTNPRRRPATLADVERAKREGRNEAINVTWSIFFTVMRDKEGYGIRRLRRLWDRVNDLADSVAQGYVKIADLKRTLREEAGIEIR